MEEMGLQVSVIIANVLNEQWRVWGLGSAGHWLLVVNVTILIEATFEILT